MPRNEEGLKDLKISRMKKKIADLTIDKKHLIALNRKSKQRVARGVKSINKLNQKIRKMDEDHKKTRTRFSKFRNRMVASAIRAPVTTASIIKCLKDLSLQ